ncbi:MAG: hypothetical protein A2782_00965 [Candidatus Blackburnbacteria bacterium RIFCSPHIGHO2_01_FULL_43_15b]|uniref:DUF4258 domain-containing protein n=1 Tax=Candidatus Blackburnbacteria bacterium RIFCSPHIGHO2_01_FULL_43_15b TaxID=1797513 RepID=A0A1G1V0X3_9BACT|nr:MAG: hypothetical protein A2782_00965 [Candidatus Blackburnbacteria bacterium RIFCSPHIGHO2_01_FULL_43_15b]
MDRKYGGVIWTNHAMQRLEERGINPSEALATWRNPDQSRLATARNSWIYYKTFGNEKIEVVASKNEEDEAVILSVWSRPVYSQTGYRGRSSSGIWDRMLEGMLNALFGWLRKS